VRLTLKSHVYLTVGSDGRQMFLPLAQSDSDTLQAAGMDHGAEIMVVLHRLKYGVEARTMARVAKIYVEGKSRLQVRIPHASTEAILERGFEDLEEVTIEVVTLDEAGGPEFGSGFTFNEI